MGEKVKLNRVWPYPSFAWFWDNDRETLLKRLQETGSDFPGLIEKHNLQLANVGDWERFANCYFVILRNGKMAKLMREGAIL